MNQSAENEARSRRPAPSIHDVPCGPCQQGYGRPHVCDVPDHCPCDQWRDLHNPADLGTSANPCPSDCSCYGDLTLPPASERTGGHSMNAEKAQVALVVLNREEPPEQHALYQEDDSDGDYYDGDEDCQHEWELRSEHDSWVCAWCQAETTYPPEPNGGA